MDRHEMNQETFDLIAQGHVAFQLLYTSAIDFDLFTLIDKFEGMTEDEIKKSLHLSDYPLEILLRGLTTLGLIYCEKNCYFNSHIASKYLSKLSPSYTATALKWQREIVYPGIVDLTESLKQEKNIGLRHFKGEGKTLYERLVNDREKEQAFQDSMSAISGQAKQYLESSDILEGVNRLVDVGGGDGSNCIALSKNNPKTQFIVFDSESICSIASRNIKNHTLEARISTHSGNIFTSDLPQNIDGIFFGHFFTIWSPEENKAILKKCYDALPKKGKIFLYNMASNDDDLGPVCPVLGSYYFLTIATGKGQLYRSKDYVDWLESSGFSNVHVERNLPMDHVVISAEK